MSHLFICTGEVSGDLQASHLIEELLRQRPQLRITAVGGERMAAAGAVYCTALPRSALLAF